MAIGKGWRNQRTPFGGSTPRGNPGVTSSGPYRTLTGMGEGSHPRPSTTRRQGRPRPAKQTGSPLTDGSGTTLPTAAPGPSAATATTAATTEARATAATTDGEVSATESRASQAKSAVADQESSTPSAKPRAKRTTRTAAQPGKQRARKRASAPKAASVEPAVAAPAAVPASRRAPARRTGAKTSSRSGTATKTRALARGTARPQVLPAKPRLPRAGKTVLDGLGVPVFGARHGSVERVDWSSLAADYRRHPVLSYLRRRRWVYATATTDRLLIALAVVDGGVTGTAFCMITDLRTGQTIIDSSRPGGVKPLVHVGDQPAQGLNANYRLPGTEYRIAREPDSNEVRIAIRLRSTAESLPGLRWIPGIRRIPVARDLPTASTAPWVDVDLTLEPTVAPPLTAISKVDADGGLVTSTVKTAAMNAWGTVTIHGSDPEEAPHTLSLDAGTGGMDYTNGFLPRRTSWRWAYTTGRLGDGRLFGLNLVSEFSGIGDAATENAVWLDGALVPIDPRVRVIFDRRDPHRPWTVRTVDGSLHLHFAPLAVHDEALNLGVLRSRFVQPTGLYSGHIMVEGERIVLDRMPGVIEDQDILW